MIKIAGKYNTAKVFTDVLEDSCLEQIKALLDLEAFSDASVRIMPDCHAGSGCVIGFTADLGDKIIPNIVGVDIGCGMLTLKLGKLELDYNKLDEVIFHNVPCGRNIHDKRLVAYPALEELHCYRELKDAKAIERAIGTLGGGNHFIEVDADENGCKYLVIHTGSRGLGKQVADYYQQTAIGLHTGMEKLWQQEELLKQEMKAAGQRNEIQAALKDLRNRFQPAEPDMPLDLCYLSGVYSEYYLHDMKICQEYADKNRWMIASQIMANYGLEYSEAFTTVHNFIDHDSNIIRKGAVSAKAGENLLIPINMRDGSLLCRGKGNPDWNYSAPHGAGRLYSRKDAKAQFTVEEFVKTMQEAGVYSASINKSTLDECPMAYKDMQDIVDNIGPTAEIVSILKPLYNFKASKR